jgi:hypothetical protein
MAMLDINGRSITASQVIAAALKAPEHTPVTVRREPDTSLRDTKAQLATTARIHQVWLSTALQDDDTMTVLARRRRIVQGKVRRAMDNPNGI